MNNTNVIMEQGKFYKQAEKVAAESKYDIAAYAGVENGYEYYSTDYFYLKRYHFSAW